VQQALGVVGREMRQAIGPAFLPQTSKGEFDAVALDLDVDPTQPPATLAAAASRACPDTPMVVTAGGADARRRLVESLAAPQVIALLPKQEGDGPDEQELGVSLRRLLSRTGADIPMGPLPYLLGGTPIEERVVGSTQEKEDALQAVLALGQRFALSDEKLRRIEVVADELLLNAIYDAPRDLTPSGSGNWMPVPRYATLDRRTPLTLGAKEQVRIRWGSDGRNFAIAVNDRFGALTREVSTRYISRLLEAPAQRAPIRTEAGGAGLGLMICFTTANQLIIQGAPARFTEVTGVLHVGGSNKRAQERGCALHLYC
jgi:hypothetical protein